MTDCTSIRFLGWVVASSHQYIHCSSEGLAKVRMYAYAPLPMYFSRQQGLSMSNK